MIKRFNWLIILLLLTLSAWVAADIVTSITGHILYEPPGPAGAVGKQTPERRKGPKGKTEYNVIIERDLLQVAKKSSDEKQAPVEKDVVRPIAEMGLTLKGTIAGPKEVARAIIEEKREQKSYKIGDEIKGATVLAIYRNKVIMDVNGQEQMLVVEEAKTKAGVASRREPVRAPVRPEAPGPSGMTSIMKNLDQYIGSARVVPYFKGGEPYGFRVSNLKEDTMVYELGVRSGDIIRSVNGIPIRTPEDAFNVYQELQNQSAVEVELERAGESTTVSVPLQ
ncbi:MAG: PDZ domain-containing protein [Deltaproteobacteria bacterium]|nr:PDZ domain-containing protein [Deltaproteobacteria bacterium]